MTHQIRISRRSVIAMMAAGPTRAVASACCGPITAAGGRLAAFLDSTGVDHLWLHGFRVNWETGEAISAWDDGRPHTHCSAFVASVAMRIGIYILRPPQLSQVLLANAQIGWLRSPEASAMGWQSMPDVTSAQMRANLADLVLAAFENPDPDKPVTSRSSARARSTRRHCWRTAPLSPRPAAAMRFRCRSPRASPTTRAHGSPAAAAASGFSRIR
jgi:hypothetical protein